MRSIAIRCVFEELQIVSIHVHPMAEPNWPMYEVGLSVVRFSVGVR
jgi:hypothetical protein